MLSGGATYCTVDRCSSNGGQEVGSDWTIPTSIVILLIILFGSCGNIINLYIWSRKRMYVANFTPYIIALSLTDMSLLIIRLPAVTFDLLVDLDQMAPVEKQPILWQGYYWYSHLMLDTFLACSVWIMTTVTLMRYIIVCHPIRAKIIISPVKSRVMLIGIPLLAISLNLPGAFISYTVENNTIKPRDELDHKIYWNIRNVCDLYIPSIMMTYFVIRLCLVLRRNNKIIDNIFAGNEVIKERRLAQQNMLTRTLVSTIVAFLVFLTPRALADFLYMLDDVTVKIYIRTISYPLTYTNFAINVVMYSISNSQFRRHLRHLVTCSRDSRQGALQLTNSLQEGGEAGAADGGVDMGALHPKSDHERTATGAREANISVVSTANI